MKQLAKETNPWKRMFHLRVGTRSAACKREKKIRVIPDEGFRASNFLTIDAENEVDEAWDLVSGSR